MTQMLTGLVTFFRSAYLTEFWWLLAGYVLCYAVAFILARVPVSASYTILYTCRKAWTIAFLLHAIASLCVMIFWFSRNGMFTGFWNFFGFYIAVAVLDLCIAAGLFASWQRYLDYHE